MQQQGTNVMMLWRAAIACTLILLSAAGEAAPLTLQLCQSNEGDYPWTLPDRPGLNNLLIERAARRSGVTVRFHPMPWARCLLKAGKGEMDGVVAASYRPERLRIGMFPMKNGNVDSERRLMHNSYLLYRRKGDTQVQWNGRQLKVAGLVGVQTGYSIAGTLRQLGAGVQQDERLPAPLLNSLLDGDLQAVALTAGEGRRLMATHPAYARRLEALPLPLEEKDFYLLFSRQRYRSNPALAERLWQDLMLEQQSPEWQAEIARFR